MLHGKCSYSTDNFKGLCAMVNKHKQKKRGTKRNTERIARNSMLFWTKNLKICQAQEKKENRKEFQHFQEL